MIFDRVPVRLYVASYVLWPAFFSFLQADANRDILGDFLGDYLFIPPSIDLILNYWISDGPLWRRVYISSWCINGFLMMIVYAWYLLRFDQSRWIAEARLMSNPKLFGLGLSGIIFSAIAYCDWLFLPERGLTDKITYLITSDFGVFFLFPLFWTAASVAFLGGLAFFCVIYFKLRNASGDMNG